MMVGCANDVPKPFAFQIEIDDDVLLPIQVEIHDDVLLAVQVKLLEKEHFTPP